ncbi:hypothetical protein FRC12_021801 [Ceratobasidium sp. 428]|nr:hypothetical protein FRC12_021801 [Ceratobasidium sp. 428]
MDETMRATTVDTFRLLSETCRANMRSERDTTSYYCRFFDHLVKYLAPAPNGASATGMFLGSGSSGVGMSGGLGVPTNMASMMPSLLPTLEDMDATWLLAANGFDSWGQGQDGVGLDLSLGNIGFGGPLG